eukprot:5926-Chlamydomonas_euryale.AAC.1
MQWGNSAVRHRTPTGVGFGSSAPRALGILPRGRSCLLPHPCGGGSRGSSRGGSPSRYHRSSACSGSPSGLASRQCRRRAGESSMEGSGSFQDVCDTAAGSRGGFGAGSEWDQRRAARAQCQRRMLRQATITVPVPKQCRYGSGEDCWSSEPPLTQTVAVWPLLLGKVQKGCNVLGVPATLSGLHGMSSGYGARSHPLHLALQPASKSLPTKRAPNKKGSQQKQLILNPSEPNLPPPPAVCSTRSRGQKCSRPPMPGLSPVPASVPAALAPSQGSPPQTQASIQTLNPTPRIETQTQSPKP